MRFFKLRCTTWKSTDRFFKDALEYAVCCGDWEKDPGFLRMTGACINFLVREGFISHGRLNNFLGTFVERVMWMRRKNYKAWDNFGRILGEHENISFIHSITTLNLVKAYVNDTGFSFYLQRKFIEED